jgi:hypothetical protein
MNTRARKAKGARLQKTVTVKLAVEQLYYIPLLINGCPLSEFNPLIANL